MKYRILNRDRIEERAAASDQEDPRAIYYRALLSQSSYEDYLREIGDNTPVFPRSFGNGEVPISAAQEYRYVRDTNKWIVELDGEGVEAAVSRSKQSRRDWSLAEVERTIEAYFAMLALELDNQPFDKSRRNEELRGALDNRTKGAVEMKHQNISAVLDEMGLPWIYGYKPRKNAQGLLKSAVFKYLEAHAGIFDRAGTGDDSPRANPIFVDPPAVEIGARTARERRACKVDYTARDEKNRALGVAGEEYVLNAVKQALERAGRNDLSTRVRWVSRDVGDGLGYDIEAFNLDGSQVAIEVKTTNGGISAPFLVTSTEVNASEELGELYAIYRVFDFAVRPRIYVLRGSIVGSCALEPVLYRAQAGRK